MTDARLLVLINKCEVNARFTLTRTIRANYSHQCETGIIQINF